jgi:hypothetical protein
VIPLASRGSCFSRNGGTGRFISRLRASATKTFPAFATERICPICFGRSKRKFRVNGTEDTDCGSYEYSGAGEKSRPRRGIICYSRSPTSFKSRESRAVAAVGLIFEQCVCHWGGKSSAHWRITHCCPFEAFERRRQWRPLNRAIFRPDQVLRILHFHRKRGRGHAASIAASLAEGALLPRDTCPSNFLTSAAPLPWQEAAASSRPKYPA